MKVAILSDIHGNYPALQRVLDFLAKKVDELWCLGDLVGYGPFPEECVKSAGIFSHLVAGNHDLGVAGKVNLSDFSYEAAIACAWTKKVISLKAKDFLSSLDVTVKEGGNILLVHGSPRDPIWEYIFSDFIAEENFIFLKKNMPEVKVVFCGHTHVPFIFELNEKSDSVELLNFFEGEKVFLKRNSLYLINSGSVGQPRDGDKKASFLLFDLHELSVSLCRVSYPIELTQKKMEEERLPPSLIYRLSYGI
jgi:predicted phosphodiesterase